MIIWQGETGFIHSFSDEYFTEKQTQ